MARTIDEIKSSMTSDWMSNETVKSKYGITEDSPVWGDYFSKVSIENILFYVVACAIYVLEKLMDQHLTDVQDYISNMEPHTLRWYVTKAKAYRYGQALVSGTDEYSDDGLSESEIDAMKIVKYASCTEENALVTLKAAKENNGSPSALSSSELEGLTDYISIIKDAGVAIKVVSMDGDSLYVSVKIWYNPSILKYVDGQLLGVNGGEPVKTALEDWLMSMPFNGELRTDALVDTIQAVSGVNIVQLSSCKYQSVGMGTVEDVNGYAVPESGYYNLTKLTIEAEAYGTDE